MTRGSATARDTSDAMNSVLGQGARIRGRVHGDGTLRVEGVVEGDIEISGDLEIDAGGSVVGNVDVTALTLAGALTGDVVAAGPITLRSTAQLAGNLKGSEVIVEEGAAFAGRIDVEFDLPAELLTQTTGQ